MSTRALVPAALAVAFATCASPGRGETVLITGANAGIGLEFVRQYAARGSTVIATHRRDETPDTLAALAAEYPNVRVERMDVSVHAQINALAAKLANVPIDVLINNAAIWTIGDHEIFGSNTHSRMLLPRQSSEAFRTAAASRLKSSKPSRCARASCARRRPASVMTSPFPCRRLSSTPKNSSSSQISQGIEALLRRVAAGRFRNATRFRDAAEVGGGGQSSKPPRESKDTYISIQLRILIS